LVRFGWNLNLDCEFELNLNLVSWLLNLGEFSEFELVGFDLVEFEFSWLNLNLNLNLNLVVFEFDCLNLNSLELVWLLNLNL
jgi:hypothetical protein